MTGLCAAGLAAIICYFLKDVVLGCHDSFYDFIFARMQPPESYYPHVLEFNLARGRVGFLAALVMSFRYHVLATGNFTAIWLLQMVPVWATVLLIAVLVGKKTKPVYGCFFAAFYGAFVQIDNSHNMLDCYPFDFAYGMMLMVIGLWLYDEWFCHEGRKRRVIFLILSVFFYYESMTVYEPFVTACFIYALISFAYVFNKRKELGRKSFLKFVTNLIPHGVTAVVFFAILKFLKDHPVVETVEVTAVDEYGTVSDFLNTWKTFSFSLFPLSNIEDIDVSLGFITIMAGRMVPFFCLFAAGAVLSLVLAVRNSEEAKDEVSYQSICLRLLVFAVSGFFFAIFFTVPHALTANYQMWVRDLNAKGYLTSSMCYFGWALMCSCLIALLVVFLTHKWKWTTVVTAILLPVLFFVGANITISINAVFQGHDAVTGQQMSYRGQAFYAFFTSDYAEAYAANLIYTAGSDGIHYNMMINDDYADFELDRGITLVNQDYEFAEAAPYNDYTAVFYFDPNIEAAIYTGVENPEDPVGDWITYGDIVLVSTKPENFTVSYTDPNTGERITEDISMGRMEVCSITSTDYVDLDSLTITLK